MDDFYQPTRCTDCLPNGILSSIYHSIPIPPAILATLLLGPLLIFLTTQLLLMGDPPVYEEDKEKPSWMIPFQAVPWQVLEGVRASSIMFILEMLIIKFFGVPRRSEAKYKELSKDLNECNQFILDGPHMSAILSNAIQNLERIIPQMISFIDTPVDLQPWEQLAQADFISSSETELNALSLFQDMTGHALVPAVFGHTLLEKCPDILHNLYNMHTHMSYLLGKLPSWMPWPGVMQARIARLKILQCLDEHQKAIDETVMGMGADASWGDLEDVSELIMKRNAIYREHAFELKERSEIVTLYSLVSIPSLVVFWYILHILSTPKLLSRLRTELTPFAEISKPFSIGTFSETPKLVLDSQGLAKKCPLLRSTYLETMRIIDREGIMSSKEEGGQKEEIAFPELFDAERFLKAPITSSCPPEGEQNVLISKSTVLVERACLAIVAAILVFWDFEPVQVGAGWKIPEKKWTGGLAVPANNLRLRVQRRKFEWCD